MFEDLWPYKFGNISLNPSPSNKFKTFRKRGFHFLYIIGNIFLSKTDDLRDFVGHTKLQY